MTRKSITAGAYVAAAVLSIAVAPRSLGQVAPAAEPAAKPATEEEVVVLSPFVVSAAEDKGYRATSTLAGTRIKTDLKDVGSAISVITEQFMSDTGSHNAENLLVYATNTEVAGQGGSFAGTGDGALAGAQISSSPVANTRVRGLVSADNTRDFFLTDIPWDSYNVGRVDLQRGPNAILFGIGSPAGLVNSSTNQAAFTNSNKVEAGIGSYGTNRISGDFNKVLLDDELAVRLSLLRDDTKYKQDPAYRLDKRVYAAFRWDPKFLKTDSARTSLRANFETGKVGGNAPRNTPPMDAITPWFAYLNKAGYDMSTVNSTDPKVLALDPLAGSSNTANTTRYNPWLGSAGNRVYDGVLMQWTPAGGQGGAFASSPRQWPDTASGAVWPAVASGSLHRGIVLYDGYANAAKLPGYLISPFKSKSLTDSSIFDFYNKLLDGKNQRQWTEFTAYNVALEQTFFNNKVGIELVYDNQESDWGGTRYLSGDATAITVDIMDTLLNGTPNPNFGKPMVVASGGGAGGDWTNKKRETMRATAFGKLDFADFMDKKSTLTKILGNHTFTALYTSQENKTESRTWKNWYLGDKFGIAGASAVGQAVRDVIVLDYLSDYSLANAVSPVGLNLSNLQGRHIPSSTGTAMVFDNTPTAAFDAVIAAKLNSNASPTLADGVTPNPAYVAAYDNNNLANYKGWRQMPTELVNNFALFGDKGGNYSGATRTVSKVDSQAFVWQGHMLDDILVPMVGWRKDTELFRSAASAPKFQNGTAGIVNPGDPAWLLPTEEIVDPKKDSRTYSKETGESLTWSVVAKTPKFINDKLPWGLNFSLFYNRSKNFQPDAGRLDLIGNRVASPAGTTKDYGFTIAALDNKLTLKINWYETRMTNATLGGAIGNFYLIGAGEAWCQAKAVDTRDGKGSMATVWGTSSSGGAVRWQPAGTGGVDGASAVGSYTQAELDAQYAIQQASVTAWFANQIPVSMQNAWGMTDYATGGGTWSNDGSKLAVTGDTSSKGTEYELTANPVTGWDIAFNASQTTAKRLNLAKSYSDWLDSRYEFYKGPGGDMRMWGNGNWAIPDDSGGTARGKFQLETLGNYRLQLALNNSNVSELRPWRFSITSNYAFQNIALLKGVNVGGSFRWEDKISLGFPVIQDAAGVWKYDVSKPYKGSAESATDFWVGYERKITEKLNWRIQFNVRNVFGSRELIPITVQPDGSAGAFRIPEPTTWTLTNTFTF